MKQVFKHHLTEHLCVRLLALVALTILVLESYRLVVPNTPIESHLARLDYLRAGPFRSPHSVRDWPSRDTVRYLHWMATQRTVGKPTTYNEWTDALEAEQQALIHLGYYQRLWINLPVNTALDQIESQSIVDFPKFTFHGDNRRPMQIRVTARPDQIHQLISAFADLPITP